MGLDMYLYAERYLSGYDHSSDTSKTMYRDAIKAANLGDYLPPNHDDKATTVKVCVGYWRKANAIHAWFINNKAPRRHDPSAGDDQGLGDPIDDCRPIDVDIDDLRELLSLVRECIILYHEGSHDLLVEKLPPTAGFFFGSTDIDEWYLQDLEDTRTILDHVITTYEAEEKTIEALRAAKEYPIWAPNFEYLASW